MKKTVRGVLELFEKFIFAEFIWLTVKYLRRSKTYPNLQPLGWVIRKSIELLVNRLKVVRNDNSFANESEIIRNILSKIDLSDNFLVDIGAADGIRQSSTSHFLNKLGWTGALFEFNPDSFSRLSFLYNDRDDLLLCKTKITPENVSPLFHGIGIPKKFSFLNIDIDSYDLSVLRSLLGNGFRPSLISMEINESFPPEINFEVLYSESHIWQGDHFFGCSLTAANSCLTEFGYVLACMEYNNAIFVLEEFSPIIRRSGNLMEIYNIGYRNKPNRKELFPWNADMEFMLSDIPTQEKIDAIDKLFTQYEGKYSINGRIKP
ncbi:hypothetical protein MCEMSE18_00029 [Candidatus Planktophila versatilis]|uniref:hypothetical protein n=1 Tax=Candidatus Planktophila versatilis TaxID=1884905 RepID=UPI003BEF3C78